MPLFGNLAMDLSPVPDFDDFHDARPIIDGVDHSILPLSDPVASLATGKLLAPRRAGIRGKRSDTPNNPLTVTLA
jgi:hypothetical protein